MKSLIQHFGTQEFPRLRIGIDKNPLIPTPDYVLGKFSKEDEAVLVSALQKAVKCCDDFTKLNFVDLMTKYNTQE